MATEAQGRFGVFLVGGGEFPQPITGFDVLSETEIIPLVSVRVGSHLVHKGSTIIECRAGGVMSIGSISISSEGRGGSPITAVVRLMLSSGMGLGVNYVWQGANNAGVVWL